MRFHFLSLAAALVLAELPAASAAPADSYVAPAPATAANAIDDAVAGRLQALGLKPADPCSDGVFVRRVFLDVIGTLPTPKEANDFLQSRDPGKRRQLIDRLLERNEFADYWAMKWSDLLRLKAEFPINLWPNAAQAYHRFIRTSVRDNLPYDQFTRELLTSSGSNFRVGQVNFYRAMQSREPASIAQIVALTFLGTRADRWPAGQLDGIAPCFARIGYKPTSEWKEEIVFFDPGSTNALAAATQAAFPDGKQAALPADRDPRVVFADWLITPTNPWFTRNIANRVWAWLMGRGVIHEPDDIRPDNPPVNPQLLAVLQQELIASKYDLKQLFRVILNSQTYQRASIPAAADPKGEANFACYTLRRLEAEVIIDALCQITGTTEKYSSAIPEPFTYIPENVRSIALPDGSISSPFLELFGRSPRDTGLESERNSRLTASQRLHLLNSSHVQKKLEQSPNLQNLLQSKSQPRDILTGLYLLILSRYPTAEELKVIAEYSQAGGAPRKDALVDVAWALINSTEFQFRH